MNDFAQQVAERAFIEAQREYVQRKYPDPETIGAAFDDGYWQRVEAAWAKFSAHGTSP